MVTKSFCRRLSVVCSKPFICISIHIFFLHHHHLCVQVVHLFFSFLFHLLYNITNISRRPVHRPPSRSTFFFFFPSFVSPTISPSTLYNIFWGNFLTFYLGQYSTACLSCQKLANSPPTISFHIVQHHQLGNFLTFNLGSCQKNWPTHHRPI